MLLKLIFKNISKHKLLWFLSIITFFIAICCIIFLNWIFLNIEENFKISQIWTGQNKFIIQPQQTNLIKNFLLPTKNLTEVYKELQNNLNIKEVFGIYMIQLPVSANISFWTINFNTDILLFASDKGNLCFSGKSIAVGINPTLINLYNSQIANPPFLPKISPEDLKLIRLQLIFWKNSLIQLQKIQEQPAKITVLDNNLPVFGLSIWYKVAKEITHKLWWNLKLIKIIWYTKSPDYLEKLKKIYPNFKITTEKEVLHQIQQKLKWLNLTFKIIQWIILILVWSFLIVILINIKEKNYYLAQTLIYNQASKLQVFIITYWEFIIYMIIASLLSIIAINWFNQQIPKIEKSLEKHGYIIKLHEIKLYHQNP